MTHKTYYQFRQITKIINISTMKKPILQSQNLQERVEQSGEQQQLQQQKEQIEQFNQDAELNQRQQDYEYDLKLQQDRGVCYMSRVPPYMKPNYIRKLLSIYGVQRIYLIAQNEWETKKRVKTGGNKKICFKEGWIEFSDKRQARKTALSLNGQKMVSKKGNFYYDDVWNLKYLPKFKWHHLTQRLAHEERLKRQRLKVELDQQKKIHQFYSVQVQKSKMINGIVKNKVIKKKSDSTKDTNKDRKYKQMSIIQDTQQ